MSAPAAELDQLRLVSAPADRFLRPVTQTRLRTTVRGGSANSSQQNEPPAPYIEIPLPFFWYDPPWHKVSTDRCRFVADLVGQRGVTIAALESDLSAGDDEGDTAEWPRLAPHRCDRAGWTLPDAQRATVIELRLGMDRDAEGRCVYQPGQMKRWFRGDDAPHLPGTEPWVPLLFPPEWADLTQMSAKVAQLRCLSQAAILVSCDDAAVEQVLPAAWSAGADGIIIRTQADPTAVLQRAATLADGLSSGARPTIWLAGGKLDAQAAVKCLALGAAAVAIDWMCDPWLLVDDKEHLTNAQRAAIHLGANVGKAFEEHLQSVVQATLGGWCSQVAGILQSLFVADVSHLGKHHLQQIGGQSAGR